MALGVARRPPAAHQLLQSLLLLGGEEAVRSVVLDHDQGAAFRLVQLGGQGVQRLAGRPAHRLTAARNGAVTRLLYPGSLGKDRDGSHRPALHHHFTILPPARTGAG